MGNQIITQPQTFKSASTVMGAAAGLSAVSGLTVYGDISATGTIYGYGATPVKTSYTFNGVLSTFVVNGYTNATPENYLVYLDGVYQSPSTSYTLSGTSIVFSQAPNNGVVADVIAYQSPTRASLIAPNSTTFTFTGAQSAFSVAGYTDNNPTNYLAYLDGVCQVPGTDYTLTNGSITFTPKPAAGVVANVLAYQSTVSMLSLSGIQPITSSFTGTGSQTAFVVGVGGGYTNNYASSYLVVVGGLVQKPEVDYTVSSASAGTINFTSAPPNGSSIVVIAWQTMPSAQTSYNAATDLANSKINLPASPTAGQVLTYNASTTTWVASAAPQGTASSGGYIQAFVNFDATRNASGASVIDNTNRYIRGSQNVTSVRRNSTGNFTISFTTPMIDANYAVSFMAAGSTTSVVCLDATNIALSGFNINTGAAYVPTAIDIAHIHVTVVR